MGCFTCLSKVFLIVFNVVFFLAGLVPLVFGSIALANEDLLKQIIDAIPGFEELGEIVDVTEFFKSYGITFVVTGSLVVVIGFLGCCGAIFKSKILLGVYLGVIISIILAEIAIFIIAVAFPETFNSTGEELMKTGFDDISDCRYGRLTGKISCGDSSLSLAWNAMQFSLECCGYSGIENYNGTLGEAWVNARNPGVLAPASCCKGVGGSFESPILDSEAFEACYRNGRSLDEYNQEGCFDVLIGEAASSVIFIAVLSVIGAIEIILVFAAIAALCEKSKGKGVGPL